MMGDTVNNTVGDISNVSGQIFIGKFNNVLANLNAIDQTELAQTLKLLTETVMASQHLSEVQKQEQTEVINQIGEEAAKPKPNKTLLKMLSDGLIAVCKAVPYVAKVVADVARY